MATRTRKGREGTETDRVKDLPRGMSTVRDRRRNHRPDGTFAPNNRAAEGKGWKRLIRDSMGPATADEDVCLLAEMALKMYRADIAALPAQSPSILAECAAAARHSALGTYYSREAGKEGLTTPFGLKLADAARQHDLCAQRHRTAAFTRAARVADDLEKQQRAVAKGYIAAAIDAQGEEVSE